MWSSISISLRISHSLLLSTQSKALTWSMKQMFFWNSLAFSVIQWIIEKAREFQKNTYFCFIDYDKDFDCVDDNKLWETLKEMGIPDYTTCLLGNMCEGQEETVRIRLGTMNWFQIGKGVHQGCILSLCLLTYMQSKSCEMPG